MATIPIVNTADKRIGIITSVIALGLLLLYLLMVTLEKADPPPADPILMTETVMPPEIDLKDFVVEGAAAGSTATDDPIDKPTPQTQEVITTNKPSSHTSPTGASTNTNANNNTNTASSAAASNNPFGGGGVDGEGGPGFGHDEGKGKDGKGGGGGIPRKPIRNVEIDHLKFSEYATISLQLTIDSKGNVTAVTFSKSQTTTTNQVIINKIMAEVQRQVKYNEAPGAALTKVSYIVNIIPN